MKKTLLAIVFLAFGAFNIHAARVEGFWSVFPPFDRLFQTQMFLDLGVALGLVMAWIFFDLKKQGRPLYLFFVLLSATALFGSMAPLLYLLCRKDGEP